MLAAEAHVQTADPGKYLIRLCSHASKMGRPLRHRPRAHGGGGGPPTMQQVEWSSTHGTLRLSWGQCTMSVSPGTLTLRAEAADAEALVRIQELVAGRLERFGRPEHLEVIWQQVPLAPGGQPVTGMDHGEP
ncbi:MAG: DUF2218 domain-containing protein [Actinomycetota bacterium]|nr:DUF2218 domain-containing protein [Actinomycetota bacterium]